MAKTAAAAPPLADDTTDTTAPKVLPWPRRPRPLDAEKCGPSLPMAKLVFKQGFDAPGILTSTLQDQDVHTQGGIRSRHTLEFYPRIRHYRVTKHLPERDYSILVWEGHVTYAEQPEVE